ncbi:MAG: cytochrome b5-like heme/steroid binding domain-containing protein [Patescibacteria group bacterium]|nr:cytochrome b5-like heme/steroid binding domain-containing protein [Patescibacteria group bacterium]
MRLVLKILRFTAWLLVLATVAELFTGFSMIKNLLIPWLGYPSAQYFHSVVLPLVFIPLFYFHSLSGLLILFTRHKLLNRKPLKIGVGVLWTAMLLAFGYLYFAPNPLPPAVQNTSASQGSETVTLTAEEIAKHNSASDCWMILDNKVYDLTSYLNAHPGTPATIIPSCGQDGTAAFNTKGGRGRPHSAYASSLHPTYYLGDVGATTTTQTIDNAKNQPAPSDGENEDD